MLLFRGYRVILVLLVFYITYEVEHNSNDDEENYGSDDRYGDDVPRNRLIVSSGSFIHDHNHPRD